MAQGSRYLSSDSTAPYRGYTTAGNTNNAFRDALTPELNDDIKNIEFNDLVRQLNPALQAGYLTKIENFLKYESECGFPGIPPSLQLFLEKIANDHNHLLSWEFDFTCNKICNEIVEITQRNENIYDWVGFYKYENGQNVLKFKKVFHPLNIEENHRTINLTNQNMNVGYSPPHTPPLPHTYTTNKVIEPERVPYNKYENTADTYQTTDRVTLLPTPVSITNLNLTHPQQKIVRILQEVGDHFIVNALKKYLDFLKDDMRATLQYDSVTAREAEFLLKMNKFQTYQIDGTLSKESQTLVNQLTAVFGNKKIPHNMGVKVVEKKFKDSKLRNVKITKKKMIKGDTADKLNIKVTKKKERTRKGDAAYKLDSEINAALSDMAIEYNPREMFLKALGKHNTEATIKDSKKDSTTTDNKKIKELSTNTTKDKRNKDDIQWQSAGTMDNESDVKNIDNTVNRSDSVNRSRGDKRSMDRDARRKRGHKIIEALSQPIESERAVRMMKLMGWSGGALGVRGEGITEPIMPALDLKSGAGFGHSSPSRRQRDGRERRESRGRGRDRSPVQYRVRILNTLLELLESKEDSLTCQFQSVLKLRQTRFIRNCVGAFNVRSNFGLSSETEKLLVSKIRHHMQTHLDQNIDYTFNDSQCAVKFQKAKSTLSFTKKSQLEKHNLLIETKSGNSTDSDEEHTKTVQIKAAEVEEILGEFRANLAKEINQRKPRRNRSPVDIKSAYKIMFLQNILSFLRAADSKIHYVYQDNITGKQCRWIENIIMNCNRRERAKYNSRRENDLYAEIRNTIDCKLKIAFGCDTRTMTLKKEYYSKRDSSKTSQSRVESKKADDKIYACDSDEDLKSNRRDKYKRFSDSFSDDSELSMEDLLVIDDCDGDSKSIAENVKENINFDGNSKENKILVSDVKENKNLEGKDDINFEKNKEKNVLDVSKSDKPSNDLIEENIKEIQKLLLKEDPLQIKVQISLVDSSKTDNNNIVVVSDDQDSNASVASKRSRNDSDNSLAEVIIPKKPRIDIEQIVAVVTDNENGINKAIATLIQDAILKSIDKLNIEDLPSLKCHGIIDKTLQYTCFNEKSYVFIKKIIENFSIEDCKLKLIILNESRKVIRKLSLRLNSYLNEHPSNILTRFKRYYSDLNTDTWDVIFENKHEDFLLLTLIVDESSYKVISDNDFCLDNGFDRAEFSVIWN